MDRQFVHTDSRSYYYRIQVWDHERPMDLVIEGCMGNHKGLLLDKNWNLSYLDDISVACAMLCFR